MITNRLLSDQRLAIPFVLAGYVSAFVVSLSTIVQAQTRWTTDYYPAKGQNDLSVCVALIEYTDAFFMVRVANFIDFIFMNDDFSIPSNKMLGSATFSFAQTNYSVSASTFFQNPENFGPSTSAVSFVADENDVLDIINAMRYGKEFEIWLPDGSAYIVDLLGSNRALEQAFQCWEENPTGLNRRDPFSSDEGGVNPFE